MPGHTAPPAPDVLLRAAGLRVTRPRLAVLTVLSTTPHSRADAVIAAVRQDTEVSTQAVYDVLNTLTERGLVRRFQPAASVARYELQRDDNHHHLVCRTCGSVTDVACATGEATCLDLPTTTDAHGFTIHEAEVTWWGQCPACRASSPDTPASPTEPIPHEHRRDDA